MTQFCQSQIQKQVLLVAKLSSDDFLIVCLQQKVLLAAKLSSGAFLIVYHQQKVQVIRRQFFQPDFPEAGLGLTFLDPLTTLES